MMVRNNVNAFIIVMVEMKRKIEAHLFVTLLSILRKHFLTKIIELHGNIHFNLLNLRFMQKV